MNKQEIIKFLNWCREQKFDVWLLGNKRIANIYLESIKESNQNQEIQVVKYKLSKSKTKNKGNWIWIENEKGEGTDINLDYLFQECL